MLERSERRAWWVAIAGFVLGLIGRHHPCRGDLANDLGTGQRSLAHDDGNEVVQIGHGSRR